MEHREEIDKESINCEGHLNQAQGHILNEDENQNSSNDEYSKLRNDLKNKGNMSPTV